ncbi:MAG: hypothetical protein JXR07_07070 [Reichenbachiella sp.]
MKFRFEPYSLFLFIIIGSTIGDQWYLSEVFFDKDYLNWFISISICLSILFIFKGYIKPSTLSGVVLILLASSAYNISYFLIQYPDFITPINYLILGIMVVLLTSALKQTKASIHISQIIVFISAAFICFYFQWRYTTYILLGLGLILWWIVYCQDNKDRVIAFGLSIVTIVSLSFSKSPIYSSQKNYYDPVVFSQKTSYQQIDVTNWKGNYWYYFDRVNQFSSLDYWMYYEPMIHPIMSISANKDRILVIGGENGLAVKELLKYDVKGIDILPYDTAYLTLAKTHNLFTNINDDALKSERVKVLDSDIFHVLANSNETYDVVIVDLYDPKDIEMNQYFTKEFYEFCFQRLDVNGMLISQSGSPYFATKAFRTINNTIASAGFQTIQFHNQILTTGEWGWTIASKKKLDLKALLLAQKFFAIETHWLNNDAMKMMLSFGKSNSVDSTLQINKLSETVLYKEYLKGNWQHE